MRSESSTHRTVMIKKHIVPISLLVLISLFFLVNILNSQSDFIPVETSSWNQEAQNRLKGNSQVDLLKNVLYFAGSEGDFRGSIKQSRLPNGDLVIIIHDDYVPDDSIGTQEQRFVARREGDVYRVIEYSKRGSCKRYGSLWDGFLSIIIHPLWTTNSCS